MSFPPPSSGDGGTMSEELCITCGKVQPVANVRKAEFIAVICGKCGSTVDRIWDEPETCCESDGETWRHTTEDG